MFYTKLKRSSVSILVLERLRFSFIILRNEEILFLQIFRALIVFRNQIWTWSSFDNQASCWILFKSISNHMRYGFLKFSFGWGLRSIWTILVNIELDLPLTITKVHAKYHRNRLRTFWVILITHKQKDKQKDKQTHTSKSIPLSQTKFGAW